MSQKLDFERFLPPGTPATVATGSNGRFAGPRPCARSPAGPVSLGLRKFLEQLLSDAAGPRPLSGGQSLVRCGGHDQDQDADDGSRRRSAHLKRRGLIIGACVRIGRTLDFAERVNAGDQPRTARFFFTGHLGPARTAGPLSMRGEGTRTFASWKALWSVIIPSLSAMNLNVALAVESQHGIGPCPKASWWQSQLHNVRIVPLVHAGGNHVFAPTHWGHQRGHSQEGYAHGQGTANGIATCKSRALGG